MLQSRKGACCFCFSLSPSVLFLDTVQGLPSPPHTSLLFSHQPLPHPISPLGLCKCVSSLCILQRSLSKNRADGDVEGWREREKAELGVGHASGIWLWWQEGGAIVTTLLSGLGPSRDTLHQGGLLELIASGAAKDSGRQGEGAGSVASH